MKLFASTEDFKDILDITDGPVKEKLLMSAIQLKVFDYLTEPKTSNEIRNILDSHEVNTELFLNALAAIGLIKKQDGMYCNSDIGQKLLMSQADYYIGEFLLYMRMWKNITLEELNSLILNGPLEQLNMGSEEVWEKNTRICINYQRLEVVQHASQIIYSLPEYPGFQKMLDLGGGAGMVAISIVRDHSTMEGVIFDQPAVVRVAQESVNQYGLDKRIQVLSGDYIKDDIGSGYDLIWASATFNFCQDELDVITRKVYDALNKGGVFIYFGDGLKHEGTYPPESLIGMLKANMMSAYSLNMSQGKVAQKMLDCGFRSVKSNTIMTNWGEMDIDIARK